jgi:nuclear cap-binding protein subunit 1
VQHVLTVLPYQDTPFSSEGQEIGTLLKRKAPDEEFQPIIDKIQSEASERALDPVVASTDVFMTAVCWVGSKSLSHVLACIDRSKGRLVDAANSSPAAQNQILAAVMAYWFAHPGIALSIVEKLLNYAILTPSSVVRWALTADPLADSAVAGEALAQPYIFELVLNTVTKVSFKTRQLLASSDADEETRKKETKAIGELFSTLNDLLVSWAGGSKDELMETGDGSSEREAMIRTWGQRWLRVFKRLGAIEEAFLIEAAKEKPVSSNEVDAV